LDELHRLTIKALVRALKSAESDGKPPSAALLAQALKALDLAETTAPAPTKTNADPLAAVMPTWADDGDEAPAESAADPALVDWSRVEAK
jgi:hypothetical protein